MLGGLAKGRKVKESGEGCQLRESAVPYGDHHEVENEDIGIQNAYFWNKYSEYRIINGISWPDPNFLRRNAIHAHKDRDIGTHDEFQNDVRNYLNFLRYINSRLPYPDDVYTPQEIE